MLEKITISEWLTITAIILGPILAVQVQKWLEKFNQKRERKLYIFRTLMGTRAARLSVDHVQALNMIDIEFYGFKVFGHIFQTSAERKVTEAWKEYLNHLNTKQDTSEESIQQWFRDGDNYFTTLLSCISEAVGYHFDKVHLQKAIYTPKAHGDREEYLYFMQENFKKIMKGELAIPFTLVTNNDILTMQNEIQNNLLKCLKGESRIKIEIDNN